MPPCECGHTRREHQKTYSRGGGSMALLTCMVDGCACADYRAKIEPVKRLMTKDEALAEARRRWGASFGHVKLCRWFDHLSGQRETLFQVGEWGATPGRTRRPQFEVRGESYDSWDEAFTDADRRMKGGT